MRRTRRSAAWRHGRATPLVTSSTMSTRQRAVAALQNADQSAFLRIEPLEARLHEVGHHRSQRDRDHQAR